MPRFAYVALDPDGRSVRGLREAASETFALEDLRSSGFVPLEVRLEGVARAMGNARSETAPSRRRPRVVDIELGLRQIAFMLRSGLPLVTALGTVAEQSSRRAAKGMWRRTAERIQGGDSLAGAIRVERGIPPVVVTLIGVGEATGTLDVVMVRAAEALERRRTLRTQLLTALTYPAIVITLSIGVTAYMMVGLMPKLVKFLSGFGRSLPPLTQFLVDISNWTQAHLVHLIVAFFVCLAVAIIAWTWPPARLVVDRWMMRVPVIGDLVTTATTSAFARNLGLLVGSGVRITDSLEVVAPVLPNTHAAREVRRVRERVLTGAGLSGPLAATRVFPPILVNMVAVGEASGALDDVLVETADFHDERMAALIKRFGALIEPAIILVLGGLVGFIYLAFFLAIYAIAPGA